MARRTEYNPRATRLYAIWEGMKARCNNPNSTGYKYYGGKGIKVCDEWINNFPAFEEWSYTNGYREYLTIDRIDSNGNYEPKNCRWATKTEQQNNRNTTNFITINGETKTFSEWAELSGIDINTLYKRFNKGDRGQKLLRKPHKGNISTYRIGRKGKQVEINGITKSLSGWSRETGISNTTLQYRYQTGMRGEDLLKPLQPGKKFSTAKTNI